MKTVITLIVLLSVVLIAGCSADPEGVDPTSVTAIKQRTLERIDALEREIAEDAVDPGKVRQLCTSLNYLMGHMETAGVGTEEQRYQLDEALYALSKGKAARPLPPRDWRPDESGGKAPVVRVPPGALREILPKLRKLIAEIPDSDAAVTVD